MNTNIRRVLWLLASFGKTSFRFLLGATVLEIPGIIIQAASMTLLVSWLVGSVPEVITQYINTESESLAIPTLSIVAFFGAAIFPFLSRGLGLLGVFKYEKWIYTEVKVDTITVNEFRGIIRVLVSFVDAIVPLLMMVAVCCLWVSVFPWLILVFAGLALVVFFLFFVAIKIMNKLYATNAENLRSEKKAVAMETVSQPVLKRPFFRMLMMPQYVVMSIYFLVGIVLVASIGPIHKFYLEDSSLLNKMLPIISIVVAMKLTSLVTLLVRLSIFQTLIERLKEAVTFQSSNNGIEKNG